MLSLAYSSILFGLGLFGLFYVVSSLLSMQDNHDFNGFLISWDLLQHWDAARSFGEPGSLERLGYVYPPLIAWVSTFFLGLSYFQWSYGWLALSVVFYLCALALFLKVWKPRWILATVLVFFGHPAFYHILRGGQNSTLSLLILVSGAWLLRLKKPVWAGVVVSCLFYKPQLAVMMSLVFLLMREWKAFVAVVLASGGWVALGLAVCGVEQHLEWFHALQRVYQLPLTIAWKGFSDALAVQTQWSFFKLVPVLALAAMGYLMFRWLRRNPWSREQPLALWLVPCVGLVLPYFVCYELVFFLPLMCAFQELMLDQKRPWLLPICLIPQATLLLSFTAWKHQVPFGAVPLTLWLLMVFWRLEKSSKCEMGNAPEEPHLFPEKIGKNGPDGAGPSRG